MDTSLCENSYTTSSMVWSPECSKSRVPNLIAIAFMNLFAHRSCDPRSEAGSDRHILLVNYLIGKNINTLNFLQSLSAGREREHRIGP
uniref:Uncharacterized protein n=1 Tax=Utricularia reniformis TaxID=192314 RepID=A0A1Y0B2G0_9LAMI|nr:hypothetical protein AEK19_MT1382 [Utricularia reniformis]ART31578.1 hypothetical protein AEK19_MT1382 [Utricularia reniformis]